jgi:hypothetical protein
MKTKPSELSSRRPGERGAALVTALLVSMLLLAAGGALVITTGMSASNAVDSTAEAQAYYAADAGLQAALNVVRRNKAASSAGVKADFRSLVCGTAVPCTNAGGDLSLWLTYEAGGMVQLSPAPSLMAFSLTVTDPSKNPGDLLLPTYQPRYLLVRSEGRGPKGATKVLEMMVDEFPFDFTTRAAVAIRSNDVDMTGMTAFSLGTSNPHTWTGDDLASLAPPVPAFAVTNTQDYDAGDGFGSASDQGMGEAAVGADNTNIFGQTLIEKLNPSSLETWLQSANNARAFLSEMRARAVKLGRLNPGDLGTEANPQFTFIDGDLTLGGDDAGAGLMIVTGNITQGGNSSFKGIVLALGNGVIDRNGTPDALGALVLANFQHNYDAATKTYTGAGDFGSPALTSAGGGKSLVGYDSDWVRKAMRSAGATALGVVEK